MLALGGLAAASLALLSGPAGVGLAVLFVALQGGGNGAVSVLRPSALTEATGAGEPGAPGFGAVSGVAALAFAAAFAIGPVLGEALRASGGAAMLLAATAAMPLAGIGMLLMLRPRRA